MTKVTLDQYNTALVERLVAAGRYESPSDAVAWALALLEDRETARDARRERLDRELAIGLEAIERGDVHDGPTALMALRDKYQRMADAAQAPAA